VKVLVAPDKFKGSLTAAQVTDRIAAGLEHDPSIRCTRLPLADGGDGSVAAAVAAGYQAHPVQVVGPTGQPHRATIAFDGTTAVVEVANTCGITLLPEGRLEPLAASSLGFGQAVHAALTLHPATVVLALGGSASTDGGLGLLTALGATITDADGQPVPPAGGQLDQVAHLDLTGLASLPAGVRWIVAGDVDAVLHGPHGAAQMFGPQKGAAAAHIDHLDRGLARLVDLAGPRGGTAAVTPGAGAAGGLGFAALLLGAQIRSGAQFFLDLVGFDDHLADADAVVTGEGRIDDQTLHGKLPYVVAKHAAPRPTFAVVGLNQITPGSPLERAFSRIHQVSDLTDTDTRHNPDLTARILIQLGQTIAAQLHPTPTPRPVLRGAS
jgi:glycerate kinase